ncbi:MAG: M18 family aminopeptidase [Acidimicrobiales bacterium]
MPGAQSREAAIGAHVEELLAYLGASPSPYHAVAESEARLRAAGFVTLSPVEPWPSQPGRFLVARGGTLIAWIRAESAGPGSPFRIVGAHTDSPNLRLKPIPEFTSAGWEQLGVEVYGGALRNSWLDRDLGISGRVTIDGVDGRVLRLVHIDKAIARVPQLAIHLDRQVNDGLTLNPQQHLTPLWALDGSGGPSLRDVLAEHLRGSACGNGGGNWVDPDDIVAWDLMFHDAQPPALCGRDEAFISSGRIDNLLSCHAGTRGLIDAAAELEAADADGRPETPVAVLALFDHEEIGSQTATGASGAWLAQVLERIAATSSAARDDFLRALAASTCVSADGAHATHPNYADRHDPNHMVRLDGGPVIKANATQRYATDAETAAWLLDACGRAGVPHQHFVSRSDMPCGSTIGPLTAAGLAVATVDVGAAMLAMHSARELAGVVDAWRLAELLSATFVA